VGRHGPWNSLYAGWKRLHLRNPQRKEFLGVRLSTVPVDSCTRFPKAQ
jgi:hypothetical protein